MKTIIIDPPLDHAREMIIATWEDVDGTVLPAVGEKVNLRDYGGTHVGTGRIMDVDHPTQMLIVAVNWADLAPPEHRRPTQP